MMSFGVTTFQQGKKEDIELKQTAANYHQISQDQLVFRTEIQVLHVNTDDNIFQLYF